MPWNSGLSTVRRTSGGRSSSPLPGDHRLVDLLLLVDLRLLFLGRHLRAIEKAFLLREHDVGAGHARRGDQADRRDLLVLRRRHQRDQAALAVADHGDPLRIHVLAIRQQLDRRAHILGVVGERRRFGAAAALADAALVVADDDVAGVGEGAGNLAEDRNAEREAVAIGRAAAADQDDGGQPRGAGGRGLRHRAGEREAVARDVHLLIVRPRDRDAARRHRGDVLAHDLERLQRHAEADHPAGVVGPEIGVLPPGRQHETRCACGAR